MSKKIGYARVSSKTQVNGNSLEQQVKVLQAEGCQEIFEEQCTGTKMDRPVFNKCLKTLKAGDTLIVTKLDRFARTTKEGMAIMEQLLEDGIKVQILNFGGLEGGFNSSNKLMFQIFLAFAEFERDMIVERTQEGRKTAMDNGVKMGRVKRDDSAIRHALDLYDKGEMSVTKISEVTGVGRATIFRRVKAMKEQRI